MEVRISVAGGERVSGLESLGDWLRGEPALAGRVRAAQAEPQPGELGSLTDALIVAVGSGGALSALALALSTWLSQPRRSHIQVWLHDQDAGKTVEINADRVDAKEVEALVRNMLGYADPSE